MLRMLKFFSISSCMSRLIYQGRYEDNGFETKEKWKGCKTSLILGRKGGGVGFGEIEGEVCRRGRCVKSHLSLFSYYTILFLIVR